MNEFQGKTAAVIGLARAGVPAAKFLADRGAKVIGFDGKTRENLSSEALELEKAGVQLVLGDHHFAGIENCDLVVLSPGLKVHFEPLQSVIAGVEARGGEVIGELELAYRFCPCPIIGITGTKGKSTTTKLVTEMLRACGVDAVSAGNTGTPLISILPELKPESWAVVEVSSFQLEKAPTFRPRIAVLLSLLEDHQDYHPNLEQYWDTKLKIFDNQTEEDWSIINLDDERIKENWKEEKFSLNSVSTLTSGKNWSTEEAKQNELDVYFEDDHLIVDYLRWKGESFSLDSASTLTSGENWGAGEAEQKGVNFRFGDDRFLADYVHKHDVLMSAADIPLKGTHNRANVAAAVAAVLRPSGYSESVPEFADAIRNFQTLPHRLEVVAKKDGITWINDSQSTIPDATIAALRSFPAPVTLLVGGRAKIEASGYEAMMRAIRDEGARVVLFGEAATLLREVALTQGVEKSQIYMENTLAEALRLAKMKALNGESVILSPACASFDQFTSYEHRGETFRQLVREL